MYGGSCPVNSEVSANSGFATAQPRKHKQQSMTMIRIVKGVDANLINKSQITAHRHIYSPALAIAMKSPDEGGLAMKSAGRRQRQNVDLLF